MSLRDPITHPSVWPAFELASETGGMELAVAEAAQAQASRPQKVSAILTACIATVDGQETTRSLIRRLSVGTREWLLQQVAAQCRPAQDWHEIQCPACGTRFDIAFDLTDLPRSALTDEFPVVHIDAADDTIAFAIPNGAVEEKLAQPPTLSLLAFLQACAVVQEGVDQLAALPDSALEEIDRALDAATPEPADTVKSTCPDCNREVTARIDPLTYAFPSANRILEDVHLLSSAYHWPEVDVLTMPSRRRRSYVGMVSTARGAT